MRFIVDVNLSRRVDVWQSEEFEFVADINDEWKDTEIWNYAKENGLTIITKDTDFANRILVSEMPPKIIHLRIGNMLLGAFVSFLNSNWNSIRASSEGHKLVTVFRDRIEVVE